MSSTTMSQKKAEAARLRKPRPYHQRSTLAGSSQQHCRSIDAKAFATLQARAALIGCTVVCRQDGKGEFFIAGSWCHSRRFDSVADLDAWLTRASVTRKAASEEGGAP